MKPVFLFTAALLAASGVATAQAPVSAPAAQTPEPPAQAAAWRLGIGTAVSSAVYAGEDTRIVPFPLVSYAGDRFFWRGIGGGVHLLKDGSFSLDLTLSARLDGIDRNDFGQSELAQRGINRALLEDRDNGLDLGMSGAWRGPIGQITVGVKGDMSAASKGYEGTVNYGYPMRSGRTTFTPHAGIILMSKKLANYYYGILPEEKARGVIDYRPGSAMIPRIGLDVLHPLDSQWAVIGNLSYKVLPRKIKDSPLVEQDTRGGAGLVIGVSRRF